MPSVEQDPDSAESASDGGNEWLSTWQTNDKAHGFKWAKEIVVFLEDENGDLIFNSSGNDLEYAWSGEGRRYQDAFISGTWKSVKPGNRSAGAFLLYNSDTQGATRLGFLIGPDQEDRKNFGAWVLVNRQHVKVMGEKELDDKLESLKSVLATKMCPGLGELMLHAKGRFLGPLLHQRIREPALNDLEAGEYTRAIGAAFGSLERRIRDASGLPPQSIGAELMKEAFKPIVGKLSDGPIDPTLDPKHKQRVISAQDYLREFFVGSVGMRNRFSHEEAFENIGPMDALREAAQYLIIASYLFETVDKQVAKRNRPSP